MYDLIKEFCEEEGLKFYEDYSGRGMFGRTCAGITCDNPLDVLVKLCSYIAYMLKDADDEILKLGTPNMDGMGLQSILYFPSVTND